MEYRELPLEFVGRGEVKGFNFKQVKANGYAYIYEVRDECENSHAHYEIFERKCNDLYGTITYPKSPAFGLYAYTTRDLSKAEEMFMELTNRVIARKEKEIEL